MQRRTLLLFTLFVVTAWFYSSLTNDAKENILDTHQQQIKMLGEAESGVTGGSGDQKGKEQG